jgi:sarcosine oxidase subunit gamma
MSLASRMPTAGVTACKVAARFGVKGAGAANWLAQQGLVVPLLPNHIARWHEHGGGRCLRLGNSEFLVERDVAAPGATHTASALPGAPPCATHASWPLPGAAPGTDDAWLLLRSDASFLLDGEPWPRELAQACSFDFTRLRDEPDLVVMTLLAGIGVTLVREPAADDRLALRLWCDASYSTYLQDCLHQLAVPHRGEQR